MTIEQQNKLAQADAELYECLTQEANRQENNLEMIASESIQPQITLDVAGSIFNNKTVVGLPGHQRLKGSQYAEKLEILAAKRACEIFGADHAIMTTYSSSVANYCAYAAFLNLGDRILAMNPAAGAHQTHGAAKNISSRMYEFRYFGLHPETLLLDYDAAEEIAREFKPRMILVGSASYSRNIDFERLADIAHRNGAILMADIAHFTGLIAAGVSPNPFPYADVVSASTTKTMCGPHSGFLMCKKEYAEKLDLSVYPGVIASLHLQTIAAMTYALKNSQTPAFRSLMEQILKNAKAFCKALEKRGFPTLTDGTDCHMFVVDLRKTGVDCERLADIMQEVGITLNTKGIPFDDSPKARGLRAGVTVLTQRGMKEEDMDEVAELWAMLIADPDNKEVQNTVHERIVALCRKFPVPEN